MASDSSSLEKKRMKLELIRVSAAKADLEFRVEEALHQIEKFKELIQIQTLKEEEIEQKISVMG